MIDKILRELSNTPELVVEQWPFGGRYIKKDIAIMIVNEVAKEFPRWIAVEERLPEAESHVLVTFEDGFVSAVGYSGDWELWEDSGDVIAWMPLPEPYKPREVEN